MNALERFILETKQNECAVMNVLQDEGVISGECIRARDVVDDENAVRWLKHRQSQG